MSDSKIGDWPRPQTEDEILGLLERARGGDPTGLAALREALDRHPEIWRAYGDLAAHARDSWIDLIAGVDLALKESLGRRVEAIKAELAGETPSALETLLIERVAACWLQMGHADASAAQAGEMSIPHGNYLRKRQDSAHRRYLSALATLAMARRLQGSADEAAKRPVASMGPAKVVEGTGEGGGEGTARAGGNRGDEGDVLEFGPQRADRPESGRRGPRRRPKGSTRS